MNDPYAALEAFLTCLHALAQTLCVMVVVIGLLSIALDGDLLSILDIALGIIAWNMLRWGRNYGDSA